MRDKELKLNTNGNIGFGATLGIVFIALKLCHVITWSWIWVLAPIWIELCIGIIFAIILILYERS